MIKLFSFQDFRKDYSLALEGVEQTLEEGKAYLSVDDKLDKPGVLLATRSRIEWIVFRAYIDRNALDPLIEHFCDSDDVSGDPFLLHINQALIELKDGKRMVRLWRPVIELRNAWGAAKFRDDDGLTSEAASKLLLDSLLKINDKATHKRISAQSAKMTFLEDGRPEGRGPARGMPDDQFWAVIEEAKRNALSVDQRPEKVEVCLREMDELQRFAFYDTFSQKLDQLHTFDAWAVAQIARGGCGNDEFDYFRAWLVSEGKEVFDAAMRDPQSVVDYITVDPQLEELAESSDSSPRGRPFSEEELPTRFPLAWAKFHASS